MTILIDNKSGAPIYDQIYSQIKAQIISGALKEDDALPSIRSLAKDLHISVITTKRAYDELEREGFIYTLAAKGCFVAKKNTLLIREETLKQIEAPFAGNYKIGSLLRVGKTRHHRNAEFIGGRIKWKTHWKLRA